MKANDIQIAGSHYKSTYQHWDFSIDAGLNPMQYQVTKYLRARKKNGVEDMRKIKHFLLKMQEQLTAGLSYPRSDVSAKALSDMVLTWCEKNGMDDLERQVAYGVVMNPKNPRALSELMGVVDQMIERYTVTALLKGDDASPNYVNQDR